MCRTAVYLCMAITLVACGCQTRDYSSELQQCRQELAQVDKSYQQSLLERQELRDRLIDQRKWIDALTNQRDQQDQKIAELTEKITQAQDELEVLRERTRTLSERDTRNTKLITESRQAIQQAQQQYTAEITRLNNELEAARQAIIELRVELAECRNDSPDDKPAEAPDN